MRHLLTIADAQGILAVSRSTIYRLHDRGELRFARIGRSVRIPGEDIEALIGHAFERPAN